MMDTWNRKHTSLRVGVTFLFAVGIALLFAPCWTAPTFISNEGSVLRLPLLSNWRNLPIIFSQEFMIFSDGMYRPLGYAVIAVLRTFLSPDAAVFWHILLIGLHGINTLLVFLLARRFFQHIAASILAAAVFCFHPLASVLANHMNNFHILLSLSFYLCSLLLYMSARGSWLVARVSSHESRGTRPESRVTGHGGRVTTVLALLALAAGLATSTLAITLPLLLLVYELFYERSAPRRAAVRLWPYLVLSALAILLWRRLHPHPLLYTYAAAQGGGWPSFFSMVTGAGWYAWGLVLGRGIPVVLDDAVERVFTWRTMGFLFWAFVTLVLLGVAFWRMAKRDVLGWGLFLVFAALLPFATTAWNPVRDYVSWVHLYAPLVGFALILGATADRLLLLRDSRARLAALLVLVLLVAQYGCRLSRINVATRSPFAYWRYVLSLDPESGTAQTELGKVYLARNEPHEALKVLFTPDTKLYHESCKAMTRYHLERGNLLAASAHAGFTDDAATWAELFDAMDVPDHAEAALGRALAGNPFDTKAMNRLAAILAKKGYVSAARRWLNRVLEIDPSDAAARSLLGTLDAGDLTACTAKPQRADRIRLLIDESSTEQLREEFARLSEETPDDPMIEFRVAYSLLECGRRVPATDKFAKLYRRLVAFSPLSAVFAYCLAVSGDIEGAEFVAERGLKRNPSHSGLNYAMGYILANQKDFDKALGYLAASLEKDPNDTGANFHMGRVLLHEGRLRDAIPYLDRVLKDKPNLAMVHIALAVAYTELGEGGKAARHYAEALQIEPNNPRTHHDWAVACYRTGDLAGAWTHVHECQNLGGRVQPDFLRELQSKMPEPKERPLPTRSQAPPANGERTRE